MIKQKKVKELIKNIKPLPDRAHIWIPLLGIDQWTEPHFEISDIRSNEALQKYVIKQSILATIGSFNFWEMDNTITWPDLGTEDWFKVVKNEKPIEEMNLVGIRKYLYNLALDFTEISDLPKDIYSEIWWTTLSAVYGGDPLRKRETLLWIILNDLGFVGMPLPNKGCIDYNTILMLRFFGAVECKGNVFNILSETKLRYECLSVVEQILNARIDLTPSQLDNFLYSAGRQIRHEMPREYWDPYFCYRLGCYFY